MKISLSIGIVFVIVIIIGLTVSQNEITYTGMLPTKYQAFKESRPMKFEETNYRQLFVQESNRMEEISNSHNDLWRRWKDHEIRANEYNRVMTMEAYEIIHLAKSIGTNVPQEWEESSKYLRYHITQYLTYLRLSHMYAEGSERGSSNLDLRIIEKAMAYRLSAAELYFSMAMESIPRS